MNCEAGMAADQNHLLLSPQIQRLNIRKAGRIAQSDRINLGEAIAALLCAGTSADNSAIMRR